MIVVSDTSPLTALLTIGEAELLPQLFREVIIPAAVKDELALYHDALPPWVRVIAANDAEAVRGFASVVDEDEAEAIELAKELRADLLLIDERKGRRLAVKEGVAVIGLIGVVILAKRRGLSSSAGTTQEQSAPINALGMFGKVLCADREELPLAIGRQLRLENQRDTGEGHEHSKAKCEHPRSAPEGKHSRHQSRHGNQRQSGNDNNIQRHVGFHDDFTMSNTLR